MTTWRKGCLCGCLIEDECRYRRESDRVVHVVHHVVHHEPSSEALAWPTIEGEVVES